WNEMKVLITSFKELVHLANPYYLGYGNPDSNILFLGKEKAFNIYQNPELFIHESVNNTLQWKLIDQKKEKRNHYDILEELGFNPLFPKCYFKQKTRKRHTWGIYSKIVEGIENKTDLLNETENYNNSFFSHCFLSEINHIPSRYSENRKLIEVRKNLLKSDFFKNFRTVIIGAKGYLTNDKIKEIFEPEGEGEIIQLDNKEALKYRNNNGQTIIYCNQLSGAAGWTNKAINKLIKILKD
ncbi:MAG TPA: hypothetical protein VFM59_05515, partial [Salinimicrobium sp.]|nr:hypothetical protein [Salinimicrobium sp.]